MKNMRTYALSALIIWVGLLQTNCFGKFALTRKLYTWNDSLGNNFVKTLVMYVLFFIPVYAVVGIIDIILLNLIEFWSGSNPISMNEGDMEKQLVMKNGLAYEITATKNKFTITQLDGEEAGKEVELCYNPENQIWSYAAEGKVTPLFSLNMMGNEIKGATVFTADGSTYVDARDAEMAMARK